MNCLDTTFLVDVLQGAPDAEALVDELDGRNAVSAISGVELWIGAHMGSIDEYRQTERLLQTVVWLPIDRDIARRAGEMQADYFEQGDPLAFNDCVIAATAIEHGYSLITRDGDFDRVDDLHVISY